MSLLRRVNIRDTIGNTLDSILGALKTSLHSGLGNPLSAYYNQVTNKYILDVHDADVHNQAVNQYFHKHLGVNTTLSAPTNADGSSYQITVVNTAGFIVGDLLQIGGDDAHSDLKHEIIAIVGNVFTLDGRIDREWIAGTMVSTVETDMSLNAGTLATPQEFIIRPNTGQIIHVTRIILTMTHSSAGDLGLFGDLTRLTNGVQLRANIGGQYGSFTNWKDNSEIKDDMYDVEFDVRSGGGGTWGTSGRGSFNKIGVAIRLDGRNGAIDGDYLEIYIQDDLTSLLSFKIKAQGHVEGS